MLPPKVKQLIDGFVQAYDSEHLPSQAVRDAHQSAAANVASRGFGPCGMMIGIYVNNIMPYIERRAAFIRDKLKESVVAVAVKPYPEMAIDLKALFESYMASAINSALRGFDNIKVAARLSDATPAQVAADFGKMIPRLKAELDLFCAKYEADQNQKAMGTVTYILNGPNARVVIGSQDYSINLADSQHIFLEITKTINGTIKDEAKRAELLTRTADMQQSVGKASFKEAYNKWVSVAADHAQLITFAPFLAELLHKLGLI